MHEDATQTKREKREPAAPDRERETRGKQPLPAEGLPHVAAGASPAGLALDATQSLWQTAVAEQVARVKRLTPALYIYLGIILAALLFTTARLNANDGGQRNLPAVTPPVAEKGEQPAFSLTSSRTYGTTDRPRVWLNYKGMETIDFRVYRIKDPAKFFKSLDDPHQMGDREKAEAVLMRQPTALETMRSVKDHLYDSFRTYVRSQLRFFTRKTFNQNVRKAHADDVRRPLNVADYARVPLLNPDQMVSSWREKLPPLEQHDRRVIPLGQREPGVYLVEAVGGGDQRAYTVAIVTDLLMVNKTTPEGEVLVYAADRKTGAPRQNVNVEIFRSKKTLTTGLTDGGGILKTKVEKSKSAATQAPREEEAEQQQPALDDSYIVMATDKENFAISDLDSFYFSEYFNDELNDQTLTGYLYTDRPIYRPGQKVYFKGIIRQIGSQGYSMVKPSTVHVTLEDPNEGKLLEQDFKLSSRGTFSGEVNIPDETPLGSYYLVAQVGEATTRYYFQIEEYKKPEYKVKVSTPKKFIAAGEKMKFDIEAKYFFGSPVANAEVKYYIYRSRYYPSWWQSEDTGEELGIDEEESEDADEYYGYDGDVLKEEETKLDSKGRLRVEFEVPQPKDDDAWDYEYRLEAQVTDSSRRSIDGMASFVGTRGNIVARATPSNYVYFSGDTARIDIKSADYEGRPVPAKLTLRFMERRWEKVKKKSQSGYEYEEYDIKERQLSVVDLKTNDRGEASYDYTVEQPGSIYIKTIVHEGKKNVISPGGYLWVADRTGAWKDYSYEDYGSIKLIPDKKSYKPGETAHVLAMLKTDNAHLLVTTELMSVMTARHIEAKGRAVIIDVPITERYAPNVFLSVSYIENNQLYTEAQSLVVPARHKLLDLSIIPNKKEYKPRDAASYTITARNFDGSPAVDAEVSLGIVDEAIYSLASESAGNIRREFYGRRYHQVETNISTSFRFTGYSGEEPIGIAKRSGKPNYQLADFKNDSPTVEPMVRKDFKDTAFWQPAVITDAEGKATVSFDLPDNLTTWRATARAVTADTRVGSTVEKVVSRKDLILRLETPRFVTAGDTVTLSGIVHNYLKADKKTDISLEVTGGQLLGAARERVEIPRDGEHRVDWQVLAPQTGQLRMLAKALTDKESDAIELVINILPRGLKQTVGQSVTISQETATQEYSFDLPANADERARQLRIEAAPTVAGSLFGALDYLTGYPYGCTEQTMSRFLPTVIVAQTLKEIKTAHISDTNNINDKVQRGLDRLYDFQHSDGGWGWWKDDETDPFMTAYVVDGLTLAKHAGYQVDATRIARGREKLKQMLDENKVYGDKPIDMESRAFMTYALTESGETDRKYVDDLFARRGELQAYGGALLALTLKLRGNDDERARQVATEIENAATVNDVDAHWESRRREMLDFSEVNDTEATALSLKALARINPKSPLLPKTARWLVTNRRNGYWWDSTKQTAFAVYGLTDYLKVSQELSPDYAVEVYLNGEQILSRQVTAGEAAKAETFVIRREGGEVGAVNRIRVVKRGRGMLYFSTTLEYHTADEEIAAKRTPELQLTREYLRLKVDESSGTPKWTLEPLTGVVRSGDLLVARLKLKGAAAEHLMIEDPIPAGTEQLARVGGLSLDHTDGNWSDWYSSREFRDEKTVIFVNHFDGEATFQYALRVQIPGDYRVIPARAELMYRPWVQSNTASGRLQIEDKR